MSEAEDFDRAIAAHPIDNQVPRFGDPMLNGHEAARQAQVKRPDARNAWNWVRAGPSRIVADGT